MWSSALNQKKKKKLVTFKETYEDSLPGLC